MSFRRRKESKSDPVVETASKAQPVNQPSMETSKLNADFAGFQIPKPQNSAPVNGNNCSGPQDHGNNEESFSQKLREIDKELGIYEDAPTSGPAENYVTQKENLRTFDLENLRSEIAPIQNTSLTPPSIKQPIKPHASILHDVTNSPKAPMHVENSSQPKWKRFVREHVNTPHSHDDFIGPKRSIDMVVEPSYVEFGPSMALDSRDERKKREGHFRTCFC
nr:hypothetical protein CFP56_58560 [Quercus suber]POF23490.1 hypothetical protein CFP56_40066 [Quercus suber]